MRAIKFRVWDKVPERFLSYAERKEYTIEAFNEPGDLVFLQYTGIKDCKSNEIFEGDFIKAYDKRWKVVFSEGCFVAWRPGQARALRLMFCEVVGNIFENPNILLAR